MAQQQAHLVKQQQLLSRRHILDLPNELLDAVFESLAGGDPLVSRMTGRASADLPLASFSSSLSSTSSTSHLLSAALACRRFASCALPHGWRSLSLYDGADRDRVAPISRLAPTTSVHRSGSARVEAVARLFSGEDSAYEGVASDAAVDSSCNSSHVEALKKTASNSGEHSSSLLKRKMSHVVREQDDMMTATCSSMLANPAPAGKRRAIGNLTWNANSEVDHDEQRENVSATLPATLPATPLDIHKTPQTQARFVRILSIGSQLHDTPATIIPRSTFNTLLAPCTLLRHLHLTRCASVDDDMLRLIAGVCGRHLLSLGIAGCGDGVTEVGVCAVTSSAPLLQCLHVDQCARMGDDGIIATLEQCTRLKTLTLAECVLVGDPVLACMAHHGRDLETLAISGLPLLSEHLLSQSIVHLPELEHISLSNNSDSVTDKVIFAIAFTCHKLSSLQLDYCTRITDDALCGLAQSSCALHLTKLTLTHASGITDHGICALAERCTSLEELSIAKCLLVTDRSVCALAQGCGRRSLRRFFAAGCSGVTDVGICALVQGCSVLEVLSIPGCPITDRSLHAIAKHLSKPLRVLQCSFCNAITAHGGCAVVRACMNLCILQLVGCRRVLGSVLMGYSQACPPRLAGRFAGVYCALRQPMLLKLRCKLMGEKSAAKNHF